MAGKYDDDAQQEHYTVNDPRERLIKTHVHDQDEHDYGQWRTDENELASWIDGGIEDELVFLVRHGEDIQPSPENDDTVE